VVFLGGGRTTKKKFTHFSTFHLQIALWLWFTVLFANFAEAMAEGRGKAQADALRKTRSTAPARLLGGGSEVSIASSD